MFAKRFIATAVLIAFTASASLAQTTTPATPAKPVVPPVVVAPVKPVVAPAVAAPAKPVAAPAAAPAAVVAKTNLNTASAADLDKLPQIGPARSKAIIDARTTKKFKDWADFTARNVVPTNAETAIKDLVSF